MMTPQEVETHVFSKTGFKGGYNMAEVDAFLDALTVDYTGLYKENAALKGKMKVLVDKIEEYRSTEDAMRMTLLSAQKMADTMLKEAEEKKAEAMSRAEGETRTRIEQIQRELANEELRLTAARNSTTAYVAKLKELYTHELAYISRLSEMGVTAPEEEEASATQDEATAALVEQEKDDEVELTVLEEEESAAEDGDAVQEDADEASEKDEDTSGDTVVFDRLQFGKDFDFE